jgi:hypothetical protein
MKGDVLSLATAVVQVPLLQNRGSAVDDIMPIIGLITGIDFTQKFIKWMEVVIQP